MLTDPDGRDWYRDKETGEITWFDGNREHEGHTHLGNYNVYLINNDDIIWYNPETRTRYVNDEVDMVWGADLGEYVIKVSAKKKTETKPLINIVTNREIYNVGDRYTLKSRWGDRYSLDYSMGIRTKSKGSIPFITQSINLDTKNQISSTSLSIGTEDFGFGIGTDYSNRGSYLSVTIPYLGTHSFKLSLEKGFSYSITIYPNENTYIKGGFSMRPGGYTLIMIIAAGIVPEIMADGAATDLIPAFNY